MYNARSASLKYSVTEHLIIDISESCPNPRKQQMSTASSFVHMDQRQQEQQPALISCGVGPWFYCPGQKRTVLCIALLFAHCSKSGINRGRVRFNCCFSERTHWFNAHGLDQTPDNRPRQLISKGGLAIKLLRVLVFSSGTGQLAPKI